MLWDFISVCRATYGQKNQWTEKRKRKEREKEEKKVRKEEEEVYMKLPGKEWVSERKEEWSMKERVWKGRQRAVKLHECLRDMSLRQKAQEEQGLTWLPTTDKETCSQVRKMKSLPKFSAGHKETVLSTKDVEKMEQTSYHVFQGHPSCFTRYRDTRSGLHVVSVCFPLLHLLDVFISILRS